MKTALIIGATSSLGNSICQELTATGWNLIVSGRDKEELQYLESDLSIRSGGKITKLLADLSFINFSAYELVAEARKIHSNIDAMFILAGDMGSGKEDAKTINTVTAVNYIAPAQIINEFIKTIRPEERADIVVISSVAGDRGRQSNYIYGSAKAALTAFCSGIRNKYAKSKIHLMTVKPGFLDTPMTYGMTSPLIFPREQAAHIIIKAMNKRKDVIYVPFIWRFIMLIIIHIPERIFKRLKL